MPKLISDHRVFDAIDLMLAMQDPSGGYATYELVRGPKWLEWLNPAEVFGKSFNAQNFQFLTSPVQEISWLNTYILSARRQSSLVFPYSVKYTPAIAPKTLSKWFTGPRLGASSDWSQESHSPCYQIPPWNSKTRRGLGWLMGYLFHLCHPICSWISIAGWRDLRNEWLLEKSMRVLDQKAAKWWWMGRELEGMLGRPTICDAGYYH